MSSSSANFDRSVWFQVQAASFAPLSLYGDWFTNGGDTTAVFMKITNTTDAGQQWQLFSVSPTSYLIRCKSPGADFYLGAGKSSPTVPMMRAGKSIGNDMSVIWNVTSWGDGTFFLTNQANGTDYHLATNSSGTMFLDPDTTKKDSQRWSFKSVSSIAAASYSSALAVPVGTDSTDVSMTSGSSATLPTSSRAGIGSQASGSPATTSTGSVSASSGASSTSGLSSGAAAGVAVAVTFLVIAAAAAVGFFLWRKRSRSEGGHKAAVRESQRAWTLGQKPSAYSHELYTKPHTSVDEPPGELPAHDVKRGHELPA